MQKNLKTIQILANSTTGLSAYSSNFTCLFEISVWLMAAAEEMHLHQLNLINRFTQMCRGIPLIGFLLVQVLIITCNKLKPVTMTVLIFDPFCVCVCVCVSTLFEEEWGDLTGLTNATSLNRSLWRCWYLTRSVWVYALTWQLPAAATGLSGAPRWRGSTRSPPPERRRLAESRQQRSCSIQAPGRDRHWRNHITRKDLHLQVRGNKERDRHKLNYCVKGKEKQA